MALLEVENLRTYFYTDEGVARAVDGVSFSLDAGEALGIVGESGSGKSVTSLSILRLVQSPPGRIEPGSSIRLRGEELLALPERRMRQVRGNDIAMIFQEPMTSLNPVHTVGAQIVETLRVHRRMGKREAWQRAVELLGMVGIANPEERVHAYPHQLSGGMRQRVMIAMALACEPDVLIADEPTTALDVTIQAQILELIGELRQRLGTAVLLITHDLGVVAEVCDRVVVMYAGQVMEEGTVEQIFNDPRHPYTEGLLAAIPRLGERVERLRVIPGSVPAPTAWPQACRFHPRCPYGWDLCVNAAPDLFDAGDGHRSRCWLEKHPERRAERRPGEAPAERYHRTAAAEGAAAPPEVGPPEAPPRPLHEHPDIEKDVER